jgi:DNA-binding MarR family transcriptional regulator
LQSGGFIERRQDLNDKRNAIIVCTDRGRSLVGSIKEACASKGVSPRDIIKSLKMFDEHCMKLPVI